MKLSSKQQFYILATLAVLLVVTVLAILIVIFIKKDNSQSSVNTITTTSPVQAGFVNYANTLYKISFDYPESWSKLEFNDQKIAFRIGKDNFTNLTLDISNVGELFNTYDQDTNKYFDFKVKTLELLMKDKNGKQTGSVEKKELVMVDGNRAMRITYTLTLSGVTQKEQELWILHLVNNRLYEYSLEYKAKPEDFDKNLSEVNVVMDSVKFTK